MNTTSSKCIQDSSGFLAFKENCFELAIVYLVSGWHKKSLTGIICTDVLLILPTTLLNFLVIYAVKKHRSLQTTANLLLASLAASDFSIGLFFQPCKIASTLLVLSCQSECWLFAVVYHFGYYLATVSFLTLAQVSLDRYVALTFPFLYQRLTTSNTTFFIAMILTWTVPFLFIVISVAIGKMRLPSLLFTFLAPVTIVISVMAQVCTIKTVSNIRRRDQSVSVNTEDAKTKRKRRRSYIREKATRVAGVILLATISCYTPHAALTLIRTLRKDILAFQGIYDWTKTLVIFNSTLNPVIYCWILKEMRKKILRIIVHLLPSEKKNRTEPTTSRFSAIELKAITPTQ